MKAIEKSRQLFCTPSHITKALLKREAFPGTLMEPAAGRGDIVKVLRECGYGEIQASDIEDWGCSCQIEDFLSSDRYFECLITNPPFDLKWEFLVQAKRLARHKFALLLPLESEYTKTFVHNHQSDTAFPWKALYSFLEPIKWLNKKDAGNKIKFGWYVFERGYEGPVLREKIGFSRQTDNLGQSQ